MFQFRKYETELNRTNVCGKDSGLGTVSITSVLPFTPLSSVSHSFSHLCPFTLYIIMKSSICISHTSSLTQSPSTSSLSFHSVLLLLFPWVTSHSSCPLSVTISQPLFLSSPVNTAFSFPLALSIFQQLCTSFLTLTPNVITIGTYISIALWLCREAQNWMGM